MGPLGLVVAGHTVYEGESAGALIGVTFTQP